MGWWRDDDSYRYGYYPRYPRSKPREARGGIKARSKRGEFGASWWARRWNAVLEGFQIGARLSRGRSYARGGQVLGVQIDKGEVRAKVQGSRPKPYEIAIQVKTLSAEDWQRLAQALARQALFAAKLLAGQMPQDIEEVFKTENLSLFPERLGDLSTKCSCPDWSNPCKHIAAVYYLLGEEFDRDPFLIFTLRGLKREELIALLEGSGVEECRRASEADDLALPELPPEPLQADAAAFWRGGAIADDFCGEVQPPPVSGPLLRRLGGFPFWKAEAPLEKSLEPAYTRASARGLSALLGEGSAAGAQSTSAPAPAETRRTKASAAPASTPDDPSLD